MAIRIKAKIKENNSDKAKKQQTIKLDEAQVENFMNDLTERITWSTNRIVDESGKTVIVPNRTNKESDGFSILIKCAIGSVFFITAVLIAYFLFTSSAQFWNKGILYKTILFIIGVMGLDCLLLGIDIFKEKDRNYIVSIFSSLVALAALIVALVK